MDQTEYLAALKPSVSSELSGMGGTEAAPAWAAQRFISLLMELARLGRVRQRAPEECTNASGDPHPPTECHS